MKRRDNSLSPYASQSSAVSSSRQTSPKRKRQISFGPGTREGGLQGQAEMLYKLGLHLALNRSH
jgi:hypothetical protein